jgi:hypothetical protein
MQFTGSHDVTIDDIAHAIQLSSRWRDTALKLVVVSVIDIPLIMEELSNIEPI